MGIAGRDFRMTTSPAHLLLLIFALCWSCEGAGPDKISADQLRNVHKAARLDKQVSFRCGLFFPDPQNAAAVPVAPLFIFNNSWAADECPAGNRDRYNKFCDSIVKPLSERLVLRDPSLYAPNADKGLSIGDDICRVLKNNVKAPFVGPKSKKFPRGIKFGMYSNQCGQTAWRETGFRHRETVCCNNGRYRPCPF